MARRPWDLVIAGGGPAGLTTALAVLRASPALAERTLVLEKHRYPRDKYCAGGLGARADKILARLGVRVDVPSVPVNGVSFCLPGGRRLLLRRPGCGRVVRRLELDAALAAAVAREGIALRAGVEVTGVRFEGGGVRLRTSEGELRARALVGADGVGSRVRRALGFPRGVLAAQVVEVDTERREPDVPADVIHFDASDRTLSGYAWDFPTRVGGQELVCRGVYQLRAEGAPPVAGRAGDDDVGRRLDRYLAGRGLEPARYRKKRFAERGLSPSEPMSRPGALLAGEAAGIDPLTGEGIAQAVEYGELAGTFLAEAFRGGDLDFAGWRARVGSSSLGRNLWVRRLVAGWFYGALRPQAERYFAACPEALELGLAAFAGEPFAPRALLRATAALAVHAAGALPAWLRAAGAR